MHVAKITVSDRVILCLGKVDSTSASIVGAIVWPNRTKRGAANHGGGDYAAQMLLGKLRKQGLVQTTHHSGSSRWALTAKGRLRYRDLTKKP